MTAKKICRALCLLLVIVTLMTLCSCAPARRLRPNHRANRVSNRAVPVFLSA